MSASRDPDRLIRAFVLDGAERLNDRVYDAVRADIDTKRQRAFIGSWRLPTMNKLVPIGVAAAAVFVVAVVGYQLLPGNGGVGGSPTPAPSPSPSLLARGSFAAKGINTTLDATGAGSNVSGTMTGSNSDGAFTVKLECERTINGLRWIGGDVTQSTSLQNAPVGSRTAIVLKPGSPVQAVFVFQMNDPRSTSCLAFFDDMLRLAPQSEVDAGLEAIAGTVELAP
jgi:hypothetical protein